MKGIVKRIVSGKTFGFIAGDDDNEYFFHRDEFHGHWTDLESDLDSKKKVEVEFEPGGGPKGPRASNVKLIRTIN